MSDGAGLRRRYSSPSGCLMHIKQVLIYHICRVLKDPVWCSEQATVVM